MSIKSTFALVVNCATLTTNNVDLDQRSFRFDIHQDKSSEVFIVVCVIVVFNSCFMYLWKIIFFWVRRSNIEKAKCTSSI